MKTRQFLPTLLVLLALSQSVLGCESFFNRIVRIEGKLQAEEGSKRSQAYSLQIHTDDTFCLKVQGEELKQVQLSGSVTHEQSFWGGSYWMGHKWVLGQVKNSKSKTVGTVEYNITTGVQWTHDIIVTGTKRSFVMKGSEVRYQYLPWVVLVIFSVAGMFAIPIKETGRALLLYNIKRRTHPLYTAVIFLKMLFVALCYLLICIRLYISFQTTWLLIFALPSISLAFIPSLFHLIYFFVTGQKGIRDLSCFTDLSHPTKVVLTIVMIAVFFAAFVVCVLLPKGLWLFFTLSILVAYQYVHSVRIRKYALGRILIYDFLLTLVLFAFSLWMPIVNFAPVSFKETLLFWNYYIFLFGIGLLLMKKMIRIELTEEIQLEQFTVLEHPQRLEFDFNKAIAGGNNAPTNVSSADIDSER